MNLSEESKASWLEVFTDMLLQGHDCMDFFLGILMHAVMSHIRDEDFFLLWFLMVGFLSLLVVSAYVHAVDEIKCP